MSYGYIAIELVVGFIMLLILTKLFGKTQISQLTPFDFISALILGELVGNAIYDKNVHLGFILFATFTWALLIIIAEWITQKLRKTRKFLEGEPSIVIRNGLIDRKQLKKNKIDIDQLQNLLRQKDVFSIREVEYAILESNGSLSVLKKPMYATPTKSDLKIPPKPVHLAFPIISDGIVDEENLKEAGFDEAWLSKQLKLNKISNAKEVFYAEWKQDEGFYCQKI
ncbi:DUF421 domain-containing protein [Pueribacillus theae]|uniref:DUF421 domain-containing protein n=1 Tax=Pueribacillus theae TaxID=2171751 RepID=A0A2U1K6U6_9BACI|nr:DUF421 domain-containing protein [Pueribacillus theae]PWA12683.1 DUF421 domain-containing protein [Pueribacillus theae]